MSTGQGAVAVFCGWEDNRGSGIALAMGHKLCGISTYGLSGIRKVDRRPAYASAAVWHPFNADAFVNRY